VVNSLHLVLAAIVAWLAIGVAFYVVYRHRQGLDFGSQYRSAIFYHGAAQEALAIGSRDLEQKSRRRQIVTEITPASAFYRAEEYHQRYLEKHGSASCAVTIGGEVTPAATP